MQHHLCMNQKDTPAHITNSLLQTHAQTSTHTHTHMHTRTCMHIRMEGLRAHDRRKPGVEGVDEYCLWVTCGDGSDGCVVHQGHALQALHHQDPAARHSSSQAQAQGQGKGQGTTGMPQKGSCSAGHLLCGAALVRGLHCHRLIHS